MPVDLTDPQQVFNRLAQIQYESHKRIARILELFEAQSNDDDEFNRLEPVAIAYLAPHERAVIKSHAYDLESYSSRRIPVEYAVVVTAIKTISVRPIVSICDVNPLDPDEIEALTVARVPEPADITDGQIDEAAVFAAVEELRGEPFHLPNGYLRPGDLAGVNP